MTEFKRAALKTDAELVHDMVDANLPYLHTQRWALQAARLRREVHRAPDAEKEAAKRALSKHYDARDDMETGRVPLEQHALDQIGTRQAG